MKTFLVFLLLIVSITAHGQAPIDTLTYLKKSPNVYAILLAKNDKVIFKKFYNQHTDADLFNDQSLTKSIVSLL